MLRVILTVENEVFKIKEILSKSYGIQNKIVFIDTSSIKESCDPYYLGELKKKYEYVKNSVEEFILLIAVPSELCDSFANLTDGASKSSALKLCAKFLLPIIYASESDTIITASLSSINCAIVASLVHGKNWDLGVTGANDVVCSKVNMKTVKISEIVKEFYAKTGKFISADVDSSNGSLVIGSYSSEFVKEFEKFISENYSRCRIIK